MRPEWSPKKRKWLVLTFSVAVALAVYFPLARAFAALRLMTVVERVASGDIEKSPAVEETVAVRRLGASEVKAITYCRAGSSPSDGVLLIPGVSELGCGHPRLVSLSRALARSGFFVLTPDIKMLREFKIYPPPLDEVSFWVREVRKLPEGLRLRRLGLAGISFSGTLALIAAAEPQNRNLVAFVLGIGCFDDLSRCSRFWFGAGPVTMGPGYYPTRYYARWIIMLAAVNLLKDPTERQFQEALLTDLLLQKSVPSPPESLSAEGRRWYRLATMREDQSDASLADQIESHVAHNLLPLLATDVPSREIRCLVFLAHGAYDDLIPPEESAILHSKIRGAKSYLLITPFITHTHPAQKSLGWLGKTRAGLSLFVFFYHLAAVL